MSHAKNLYDRQETFLESKSGVTSIISTFMALIVSIALHLAVLWVFLFLLSSPPSLKNKKEYIMVQIIGGGSLAPATVPVPDVKPNTSRQRDTVSEPPPPQISPFTPPEILTAQPEVIPLGPKAPEKPPEIVKKATPPPEPTPPALKPKEPPKKPEVKKPEVKKPEPVSDTKAQLALLQAKIRTDEATAQSENSSGNALASAGSGAGDQQSSSNRGERTHPEIEAYVARLKNIIMSNFSWATPPGVDASKLMTSVNLLIQPNGRITLTTLKIEKSSGYQTFDSAVIRAINLSNPHLPPLPSIFGGKPTEVQLDFHPDE